MKLFEITNGIKEAAEEYMQEMLSGDASRDEFGDDFNVICTEPGNCATVSGAFDQWVMDKGHEWMTDHGIHKIYQIMGGSATDPEWAKHAGVEPGSDGDAHTVSLVNSSVVIDFTARQFDHSLPCPRIIPLTQFKREWTDIGP